MKHGRSSPSLRRLALLLMLPVLVLAGMGVWVLHAERVSARARLTAEAKRWADWILDKELDDSLSKEIQEAEVRVPRWIWDRREPPPVREVAEEWEKARDLLRAGNKAEAAKTLPPGANVNDQDVTASGLPLLLMVRRTYLELNPTEANAEQLARDVLRLPCVLSERLAADAAAHLPEARRAPLLEKVKRNTALLEYAARSLHYAPSFHTPLFGWHVESKHPDFISGMPHEEVAAAVDRRLKKPRVPLPRWAGVTVSWNRYTGVGAHGELLARATNSQWSAGIILADPYAYYAEFSDRTNFLTWVLSTVMLVVIVTVWLIYRTFKKQAKLAQLQSEFVASVSHELRTPVASIGVLAERLEEGKADAGQTVEYHRFIAREGRRLASLVDNVLDFSRIERGAKAYDREHTDLPRLMGETAALMRPHAEEKGLSLTEVIREVPENLWPPVDSVAIRQALVNLLDNAIKFTPAGGTVTVEFDTAGDAVVVRVRDTGIGIPAAEHTRIFERFHRVDNGLRRETTGVGIGLSIVKHIAEAHGARVSVTSEPGQGAAFEIRFTVHGAQCAVSSTTEH